jgi:SAM-dependent methyltransferase
MFLVCVQEGVIHRLVEGPAGAKELAESCGVDAEALERMLNALVSIGLLCRGEGGDGVVVYSLPEGLAAELGSRVDDSEVTVLDGLAHRADGLKKWMMLDDVVRRGYAEFDDELDVTRDPERNEVFIRAMHAYAGGEDGPAKELAERLPREGAKSFLDVGGGPGTFALAFAERWPGLKAVVVDLALTLRVTRRVIGEHGMEERVGVMEADFYRDREVSFGGPWDLVLVSAVIHTESAERNRELFRRLRPAVSPGGRIVVREHMLAEDRVSPERAALFDVHMLVSTRRGRCYTAGEVCAMLEDAGFRQAGLVGELSEGLVMARA